MARPEKDRSGALLVSQKLISTAKNFKPGNIAPVEITPTHGVAGAVAGVLHGELPGLRLVQEPG